MSAYIHTYTYIHTHIQNVYINTRKHAWNDGAAANVQGAVADQGSFAILFRSTQLTTFRTSNARTSLYPRPASPVPLQRCSRATVREHAGIQAQKWSKRLFTRNEGSIKNNQSPQAAHHANHDSAVPRQHPLICTGAEPIHQVHGPPKLRATSRYSK